MAKVIDCTKNANTLIHKKLKKVTVEEGLEIATKLFQILSKRKDGIGLAANQVGIDLNLFIIYITHTDESEHTHTFINSSIIETGGDEELFQEGCLSLPGIALDVLRPEKVKLKYQTLDEQWHEDEFEGLLARAIQHEMDHLNGVFIVDRVSEIERIQYQKDLKELERKSKNLISSDLNQKGFVL